MFTLRPYERLRGVETVGELWTLRKNAWRCVCTLTTHPLGWELRTMLNDDLARSEVCKTEMQVLDTADAWRAAWEQKGWSLGQDV
jgi:hypothetical protein